MEENAEYGKQLSEIHEIISESQCKFTGGGAIALVWGVLTAIAVAVMILFPGLGARTMWVWVAHNVLGWTTTLSMAHWMEQKHGRVSRRGQSITRTWAVWTLAIWIMVGILNTSGSNLGLVFAAIMTLIVGMGIFVTGMIGESRFSQIMGVAAMVIGPGLAVYAPNGLRYALAFGSMVVIIIAWGIGSWVVREK
jgi:hypothetical protein